MQIGASKKTKCLYAGLPLFKEGSTMPQRLNLNIAADGVGGHERVRCLQVFCFRR